MGYTVVAPVGGDLDALFVGIRQFPTDRVVLIANENNQEAASQAKTDLDRFKIPAKVETIQGNMTEEMFRIVGNVRNVEGTNNILINVATGDADSRCAATSAAYVNGLKAFSVMNNEVMMLPVLKFSYYRLLTDKKMEILRYLTSEDCCSSLEELSKRTGMSLPLVYYHINGNLKSEGLKDLGLVETVEKKGKIDVRVSTLGKILIKGYVDQKEAR